MTDSALPLTCAFCGRAIPQTSPDLVNVTVESHSTPDASDWYFAHRDCFARLLAQGIPPGEVLESE